MRVVVDGEGRRNAVVAGALEWAGCCHPVRGMEDLGLCSISLCPMQLPREHCGQALLRSRVGSVQGWGPWSLGAHGDACRAGTLANR